MVFQIEIAYHLHIDKCECNVSGWIFLHGKDRILFNSKRKQTEKKLLSKKYTHNLLNTFPKFAAVSSSFGFISVTLHHKKKNRTCLKQLN